MGKRKSTAKKAKKPSETAVGKKAKTPLTEEQSLANDPREKAAPSPAKAGVSPSKKASKAKSAEKETRENAAPSSAKAGASPSKKASKANSAEKETRENAAPSPAKAGASPSKKASKANSAEKETREKAAPSPTKVGASPSKKAGKIKPAAKTAKRKARDVAAILPPKRDLPAVAENALPPKNKSGKKRLEPTAQNEIKPAHDEQKTGESPALAPDPLFLETSSETEPREEHTSSVETDMHAEAPSSKTPAPDEQKAGESPALAPDPLFLETSPETEPREESAAPAPLADETAEARTDDADLSPAPIGAKKRNPLVRWIDFLLGYEKPAFSIRKTRAVVALRSVAEYKITGISGDLPRRMKKLPLRNLFSRFTHLLACTSTNAYGVLFLAFGITTLLVNFGGYYLDHVEKSPLAALIAGAVASLLAVPLLLSATPFSLLLQNFGWSERLFFEIFCFRHLRQEADNERGIPLFVSAILGIGVGVLGYILPLFRVLAVVFGLLFLILSLSSPEFTFLLALLALPALPLTGRADAILAALVGIALLSYCGKILLGKRVFRLSAYEVGLLFLLFFLLLSGAVNGRAGAAAILCVPILSYLLGANLTANRRIADSAVSLLLFASVPTAAYGISDYFVRLASRTVSPENADRFFLSSFGEKTGYLRAASTFADPDVFAAYLLVAVILAFAFAVERGRPVAVRIGSAGVCLLDLFALFLTFSHGAWIALVLAAASYPIFRGNRKRKILLIPMLLLPAIPYFLPADRRHAFFSFFSLSDAPVARRVQMIRTLFDEARGSLFFGVGPNAAVREAPLFLQLLCSAGIPVLLFTLFLLLYREYHADRHARDLSDSSMRLPAMATEIALFALLAFGSDDFLFRDGVTIFLFSVLFGIGVSSLRICRSEARERDSYNAENTASFAVADLPVKNGDGGKSGKRR